MRGKHIRLTVMIVALVVANAACGGTSESDNAPQGDAAPSVSTGDTSPPDSEQGGGATGEDPGVGSGQADTIVVGGQERPIQGTATVVIGDDVYEFKLLECGSSDEQGLGGSGLSDAVPDEDKDYLQFYIQPEGSTYTPDAPSQFITIADAVNRLNWHAGGGTLTGYVTHEESAIVDWTLDGMATSGSALFVEAGQVFAKDENANATENVSIEGTFAVDCS